MRGVTRAGCRRWRRGGGRGAVGSRRRLGARGRGRARGLVGTGGGRDVGPRRRLGARGRGGARGLVGAGGRRDVGPRRRFGARGHGSRGRDVARAGRRGCATPPLVAPETRGFAAGWGTRFRVRPGRALAPRRRGGRRAPRLGLRRSLAPAGALRGLRVLGARGRSDGRERRTIGTGSLPNASRLRGNASRRHSSRSGLGRIRRPAAPRPPGAAWRPSCAPGGPRSRRVRRARSRAAWNRHRGSTCRRLRSGRVWTPSRGRRRPLARVHPRPTRPGAPGAVRRSDRRRRAGIPDPGRASRTSDGEPPASRFRASPRAGGRT